MKKFPGLLVAVVIILFAASVFAPGPSAAGNLIGTVDMDALYAFHPLMQYYDNNAGLFIKPAGEGVTYAELQKAIELRALDYQQNLEARSGEIAKLKAEIKKVNDEIKKVENISAAKYMKLNDAFSAELAKVKDQKARQEMSRKHNVEFMKVQAEADAGKKSLEEKLSAAMTSCEKAQREILKSYYLSADESADFFKKINDEIKEAINYAAAAKGIKAVINTSRISSGVGRADSHGNKTGAGEIDAVAGKAAAALEKGPDYSKVLAILQAGDAGREEEGGKGPGDVLKKIYLNRGEIASLKFGGTTAISNSPILTGGEDLTLLAVVYILKKHNVPKENAEVIGEIIMGGSASKE